MNFEESLKSKMLLDIISLNTEYSFDVNYRNDLTLQERIDGFTRHVQLLTDSSITNIVEWHGKRFFLDGTIYTEEEKEFIEKLDF